MHRVDLVARAHVRELAVQRVQLADLVFVVLGRIATQAAVDDHIRAGVINIEAVAAVDRIQAQPARHAAVVVHALHLIRVARALRRYLRNEVLAHQESLVLRGAVDRQMVHVRQVFKAVVIGIMHVDQDGRQRFGQVHDDVIRASSAVHIHAVGHAGHALLAGQRRQLIQHDQVVAIIAVQRNTAGQRARRQVDRVVALARQHGCTAAQQNARHPDLVVAGARVHCQVTQEIGVRQVDQVSACAGGDAGVAADRHRVQQHDVVAVARVYRQGTGQIRVRQGDLVHARPGSDRRIAAHCRGLQHDDVVAFASAYRQ